MAMPRNQRLSHLDQTSVSALHTGRLVRFGWNVNNANSAATQIAARLHNHTPTTGERAITGGGTPTPLSRRCRTPSALLTPPPIIASCEAAFPCHEPSTQTV